MNVYIFAIGGTGARVLRSLTFCLASGIEKIPDGTNIVPLIIDYDKDNADKERTIQNLETYLSIHNDAYNGVEMDSGERNFFHPQISYLSEVAVANGKQDVSVSKSFEFKFGLDDVTNVGTFADYIDYDRMVGENKITQDLLSSLYNDEEKDVPEGSHPMTELQLELSKGFKGNPNIGSIIFENIKDDAEFKRFENAFDPANDRVFIISSIFGGTGSSGFPRIVDAIHYSGITGFDNAMVGACIVMPYFKVNTPKGGAINSNIFASKQKAALSYYAETDRNGNTMYDKLTSAYFIGDDNPTSFHYSEGSSTQKNDGHIVEFLSALSILDFICKDRQTLAEAKYREYGLASNPPAEEKINFLNFDKNDYDDYLEYIMSMALAFKYYKEYLVSGDIPTSTAFYRDLGLSGKVGDGMYDDLEDFIKDFDEWLDEMAIQKDALKPFLQTPRDKDAQDPQPEDLYDYINGMEAPSGGLLRKGATYKSFNGFCNEAYRNVMNSWNNKEQVFLATLYDASANMFELYSKIKK